jgi:uncharacterized protein YndB with AHSA1/START domain
MLGFKAHREIIINASPQVVFDIVGDISQHHELAGSGEVLRIRKTTAGPVQTGTQFEADEDIPMGPTRMKFISKSQVVTYNPPTVLSWTSMPMSGPKAKRIQWWFRLTPQDGSTRVVQEVEVDFGAVSNFLMKLPYQMMRGGRLTRGVEKTLQNLKQLAEKRATGHS